MRLVVLAPSKSEADWAAIECRRKILLHIGYGLSGYQIFTFHPDATDSMRGFALKPGDHVFYVEGWDYDREFAQQWDLCSRVPDDEVWMSYHRNAPVKS